jgi:putative tryptophan/tyrosine transport system substrate-binding protein
MKRRAFIAGVGSAAAWPLVGRAQQPERMRHIGVLMGQTASDLEGQSRVVALRRGLLELGWKDGRNVQLDVRWFAGEPDRATVYAKELVDLAPDVIIANTTPGLAAVGQATGTIPIVFLAVTDPVGSGYVAGLAHPGGNITGLSTFEPDIGGKWLEVLKLVAPATRRVAVIVDPDFAGFAAIRRAIEVAAPTFEAEVTPAVFHDAADIEPAVVAVASAPNLALIVLPHAITTAHRDLIVGLAERLRLPAVYPFRFFATSGGLMSYGIDITDLFRRSASYVDRILKGAKAGDLPVQAPTKYELVINLRTAKALGLNVPPSLLARADEVIE